MDSKAKHSIWLQFQDLLPKTWSEEERQRIALCVAGNENMQASGLLREVYEAAIYAGWCRGYAEGDGAHRKAQPELD